ncbi:MAG: NAD(P)-dependent oxidoreductase [Hoeflea sp.]|uniref:NAD(P)-dependent oxidoreductase n=1 Tax=Hoeflea sp. TaxID=1940281 RepID=UPI0032EC7326
MSTSAPVGVVGLGIMGSAFATNLLEKGFQVVGTDPVESARSALEAAGGSSVATASEVAKVCDCILVSLPSVAALDAVTEGRGNLCEGLSSGKVVVELGTLPLEAKDRARFRVEAKSAAMLDCPVSGTGAQAAKRDLVLFASGETEAIEKARPVLEAIARDVRNVGEFGTGIKIKYVANLLVAVHNVAAAEALLLAERSGLDLSFVLDAVTGGAGGSKMLELRGPLMARESYEPATMKIDVFQKDLALIADHAASVGSPSPLLDACKRIYDEAMAQGRGKQDTAAVFSTMKSSTFTKI